jgi:hypothetical protein
MHDLLLKIVDDFSYQCFGSGGSAIDLPFVFGSAIALCGSETPSQIISIIKIAGR